MRRTGIAGALRIATPSVLAFALLAYSPSFALASVSVTTVVSTDPFTNTSSFHATEVEPDTFSFGSTVVAAFQVGRFQNGGASDIGWATTTDGGTNWTHGTMPGTTPFSTPTGSYNRVSDPSVAYDARHSAWMVSTVALKVKGGVHGKAVLVSRSTNGGTSWVNPVTVRSATRRQDFDKNWTVCDNTVLSPHYGSCYTEYDDFGHGNQLHMSVSTNGGLTWAEASIPAGSSVIGGQPVVQPNGTVVVPIDTGSEGAIESFVSTNGGTSFSGPYAISSISDHTEAGNLRSGPLPSADVDASGQVYVVWADCRFRTFCTSNDIVMSTSSNGTTWTTPVQIPIDATSSTVDHFLPGIAVQTGAPGTPVHLGLIYYYYPATNCGCDLDVGYISSSDGGSTWSAPTQLAGPMQLSWLPQTTQGPMVGDYMSTSFAGATALPVFANANAVAGKTCTLGDITSCDEFMVAPSATLIVTTQSSVRSVSVTHALAGAHSDHAAHAAITWR